MAHVKWFQEHNARYELLKPAEIWHDDLFKPLGPASYIPIEKIQEVCVTCRLFSTIKLQLLLIHEKKDISKILLF